NPRLQQCLEEYVYARLEDDAPSVTAAISAARGLDVSYLPEDLSGELAASFDAAEDALRLLPEAMEAGRVKEAAAGDFRPILRQVRALEREIRGVEAEMEELRVLAERIRGDERAAEREAMEARIAELAVVRDALVAEIPETWEDTFAAFRELESAETGLRRDYRRAGDASAEAPAALAAILASTEALRAIEPELQAMLERIRSEEPEALVDPITELRSAFSDIEGARDVRGAVNDARSALRGREPNPAEAIAAMEESLRLHAAQIAWRDRAETELRPGLETYVQEITQTVGARQRESMPRSMALSIAACESNHRDLSLHF
ncbi:MAG: C4-dicarboxylate ABC transporter permease, partial [Pseudomonadota bacterium]